MLHCTMGKLWTDKKKWVNEWLISLFVFWTFHIVTNDFQEYASSFLLLIQSHIHILNIDDGFSLLSTYFPSTCALSCEYSGLNGSSLWSCILCTLSVFLRGWFWRVRSSTACIQFGIDTIHKTTWALHGLLWCGSPSLQTFSQPVNNHIDCIEIFPPCSWKGPCIAYLSF